MLIEQIIKFQLRGPGSLGRTLHILLQPVIFMAKQKTLRQIFEWINYLLLKYRTRQCTLHRPNLLQNLIPKSKILNVFWT